MKDSVYKELYKKRVQLVLDEQGISNPYVIDLIEFLFTRTIWIRRSGMFKAYIDVRSFICSTLLLPSSIRLLLLVVLMRYEYSQVHYYESLYPTKDLKINTYTLGEIYVLLTNVNQEAIHQDIYLLLPNSPDDIIEFHYERLYSLYPLKSQQKILNVMRNRSSSLMLDIKSINKELGIYSEYTLNKVIAPICDSNSIGDCLYYIGPTLGLTSEGVNAITYIYNNMMVDIYQSNQ